MKKTIFIIALLFGLSSCSNKLAKVLYSGSMESKSPSFMKSLPYENFRGLIITEVQIEGKTYRFLFDTGAPTAIAPEIQKELGLKAYASASMEDSQNKRRQTEFVKVDEITLAGVAFRDIGALVLDMRAVPELACMNVDGIVGANLMRKAFWKLDPVNEQVHFGNSREQLGFPESDETAISFIPKLQGTPKVTIQIGKISNKGITFDTGYGGFLSATDKLLELVNEHYPKLPSQSGYGATSAGVFGAASELTTEVFVKNMGLSKTDTTHIGTVSFEKNGSELLGADFLKNFYSFMDWEKRQIHLVPHGNDKISEVPENSNFGFLARHFADSLTTVSFVYEGSEAQAAGLEYGDCLISIESLETKTMSAEQWCKLTREGFLADYEEALFVFEKENGKQIKIRLKRTVPFKED